MRDLIGVFLGEATGKARNDKHESELNLCKNFACDPEVTKDIVYDCLCFSVLEGTCLRTIHESDRRYCYKTVW